MFKGNWKRWLGAGIAVFVLSVGVVGVVSAHGGGGWFGGGRGNGDALLAEELGITVEELQAAQEAARTRALEQALADGDITQEQYDAIKIRQALAPYLEPRALLAAALDVSVDELDTKSLSEWLDEKGLDRTTLRTQLKAAHAEALAQAVADGVITQEQADAFNAGAMGRLLGGRGKPGMMHPGMRGRGGLNDGFMPGDGGALQNNRFLAPDAASDSDF